MGLAELLYGAVSVVVTIALWYGVYWLIRRSTAAGVREGGQIELLQRQLDAAQREVQTLRRRVEDLEGAERPEG